MPQSGTIKTGWKAWVTIAAIGVFAVVACDQGAEGDINAIISERDLTVEEAEARLRAAEAAEQQAQSQVEAAEKKQNLATADEKRAEKLFKRNGTSPQNYEHAVYEAQNAAVALRSAKLAVQIAKFERQQARAALLLAGEDNDTTHFPISAPIDGRVLRVFQESSTVVQAGERLMELGDPKDLEVAVDVLSTDAVNIQAGAEVSLRRTIHTGARHRPFRNQDWRCRWNQPGPL